MDTDTGAPAAAVDVSSADRHFQLMPRPVPNLSTKVRRFTVDLRGAVRHRGLRFVAWKAYDRSRKYVLGLLPAALWRACALITLKVLRLDSRSGLRDDDYQRWVAALGTLRTHPERGGPQSRAKSLHADATCIFGGSSCVPAGLRGPWLVDPLDGTPYRAGPSSLVKLVAPESPGDIRSVWEVNRLHQAVDLALATALGDTAEGVTDIRVLLDSWMDANPVNRGPNWTCAMEVAIRAVNVITAYEILASVSRASPLSSIVDRMMVEHGLYIRLNLEKSDLHGNHYIADLVGLATIGHHFGRTWFGRSLCSFALSELEREAAFQLRPDGAARDGTLHYHLLVTEMYLHAAGIARQAGRPFSVDLVDRLIAAGDFLEHFLEPAGGTVRIGDSDDGRLLRFSGSHPAEARPILTAARALVAVNDAHSTTGPASDPAVALRIASARLPHPLASDPPSPSGEATLPAAWSADGFAQARAGATIVWMRCGGETFPVRSHNHDDHLAITVAMEGCLLITDPGNPRYGGPREARRQAIGSTSHNGPLIDGRPYEVSPGGAGILGAPPVDAAFRTIVVDDGGSVLAGEHRGYWDDQIVVSRAIRVDSGGAVLITDRATGVGRHSLSASYLLGPGLRATQTSPHSVRVQGPTGADAATMEVRLPMSTLVSIGEARAYPTYCSSRQAVLVTISTTVVPLPVTTEVIWKPAPDVIPVK